jgi:single stranded DNA-binding protein
MSLVEVRQIGYLAAAPQVATIQLKGRTETKARITVISNARWKGRAGQVRERVTAIRWTMWGKNAMNASWYLDNGSKVAIAGTVQSRRYTDKSGKEVSSFDFVARSLEYLDSRAEAESRRKKRADGPDAAHAANRNALATNRGA